MNDIIEDITKLCDQNQDHVYAAKMKWYMKDHFEFYGINAPKRKELVKTIKQKHDVKDPNKVIKLASQLWVKTQRELQYTALDLLSTIAKKLEPQHVSSLEHLITHKSWWDTVDNIAPNLVGSIWQRHPEAKEIVLHTWITSDNMWLNRSAIIHQLRYKNNVDLDLLATAILTHDKAKEFFIRKAQGWALREVAKQNPQWVRQFLDANPQLSGLTHREATKHLSL
jgi:3-methyladenine DNA glycosylase AlkD